MSSARTSNKVGLFGLIPAVLAIVFIAIAVSVNKWQSKNAFVSTYVKFESEAGLWRFCNKTTLISSSQSGLSIVTVRETLESGCYNIVNVYSEGEKGFVGIVRHVLFAGLACMVLAILGTLIKVFVLKDWLHEKAQVALGYVTAVLAFLTGALAVVAFGMFDARLKFEDYTLQAPFYLTLVTWLLSWITGGMFLAGGQCIGARTYPGF